jgi:4'-phosphopantetheinyl transferase
MTSAKLHTRLGQPVWALPNTWPLLQKGEMHIWRVNLRDLGGSERVRAWLSTVESARADKMRIAEKRSDYIVSHAALRVVLGKYLNISPQDVALAYIANGKPCLADPELAASLQFNLSHSGAWMLLAVSPEVAVGVDIEQVRPLQNMKWALTQLFSAGEREILEALPLEDNEAAFINIWTLKEALGKADGRGISARVDTTNLIQAWFRENKPKPLRDGILSGFQVTQFEAAPGFCASLALAVAQQPRLHFFDLADDQIETI